MKVLIDTNVLIDFLTKRNQTFYESAGKIINYCFCKKIKGCIAAHTVMNSFYVLRKIYTLSQMRNIFLHLSQHIDIISIDNSKIQKALNNNAFTDFEDCLQAECALSSGADYIVTRNIKDFVNSSVPAILPEDFLKLI